MTFAGRARWLGLGALVALGVAAPAAADPQPAGVGWTGEVGGGIDDGHEFTGTALVVPVSFEYQGAPGSEIVSVTLELSPVDDACDSRSWTQPLGTGDGDPTATTATTAPPPPTAPSGDAERAEWTFEADPRCNGTYDLAAYATADPSGPARPGDPNTQSEPIVIEDVRVSLPAPPPVGVEAVLGPDRKVTVRWSAPPGWAEGEAPADFRGYRLERIGEDGAPVRLAQTGPGELSFVDDGLAAAPPGAYRYRVTTIRSAAGSGTVSSEPVESTVELAAATVAPSTAAAPGRGAGVTTGRTSGRAPAVAAPPTTEFDPGFDETLDYGDAEFGAADAVPPGDLDLFDAEEPLDGAGLLVPFAVALCLAVWAGHLRHLSRRASPPVP